MTRNTERRVEIACPVLDTELKERIYGMLEVMLRDNTKAWEQFSDGRYILRTAPEDLVINSQNMFIEEARAKHIRAAHFYDDNKQNAADFNVISFISYIGKTIKSFFSRFRGTKS